MKWAVVVFPGSNCDEDAVFGIREATGDPVDLVWHQDTSLDGYDAVVLPGGFSYGDYLRSGAIARISPIMKAVQKAAAEGRLVLGICNGFQILTEAGLLPGALLRNANLQFRCEMVELVVENNQTPFTAGYQMGEVIRIPIAHGEGRYQVAEAELGRLQAEQKIAFTYRHNPNGSMASVAGVLGAGGNVLGLMPHPERAAASWMHSTDGLRMFSAMHASVQQTSGRTATLQAE